MRPYRGFCSRRAEGNLQRLAGRRQVTDLGVVERALRGTESFVLSAGFLFHVALLCTTMGTCLCHTHTHTHTRTRLKFGDTVYHCQSTKLYLLHHHPFFLFSSTRSIFFSSAFFILFSVTLHLLTRGVIQRPRHPVSGPHPKAVRPAIIPLGRGTCTNQGFVTLEVTGSNPGRRPVVK